MGKLIIENQQLKQLVRERFQLDFSERVLADYVSDGVEDIDLIAYNEHCPQHNLRNVGDDNEEDGQPVVIASHEVEASIARSSIAAKKHSQEYQHEFPLLYAAMTSGEDEVMARARI